MLDHQRLFFSKVVFLGLFVGYVPFSMADSEVGKLALVNGDVKIVRNSGTTLNGKEVSAKPNDSIQNTDVIKTGPNSMAKVLFTDQSLIDVGPESAMKVSDYALNNSDDRTGTFSLAYGKMRALVTQKVGAAGKVEVKSGSTVMGVRGTEFMVDAPKPATGSDYRNVVPTLVVASGIVQTRSSNGAVFSVTAGQMITVTPKIQGAGSVQTVGSEQMQSMMNSVKTEDHTFTSAVSLTSTGGDKKSNAVVSALAESGELPPPPKLLSGAMMMGMNGASTTNFLPPVSVIPGNPVHLSVKIQ